jgi:hypothetical protein
MREQRAARLTVTCVAILLIVLVVGSVVYNASREQLTGQVIEFNGQTLDLSGASNVMVQSSNDVRVFDADEQGGVVTVTTSIVTVTVWMQP